MALCLFVQTKFKENQNSGRCILQALHPSIGRKTLNSLRFPTPSGILCLHRRIENSWWCRFWRGCFWKWGSREFWYGLSLHAKISQAEIIAITKALEECKSVGTSRSSPIRNRRSWLCQIWTHSTLWSRGYTNWGKVWRSEGSGLRHMSELPATKR